MTSLLITGVGGGVGQSILKSLQDSHYRLIGSDGEALATGLYAATKSYLIPYASDPNYVPKLIDICRMESCSLIFPGLDAELPVLALHRQAFRDIGVIVVVSDPTVIRLADDKLDTSRFLTEHGFPSPKTLLLSSSDVQQLGFPLVLKPMRGGARSAGVFRVMDKEDLARYKSKLNIANYVAQEYIEGDEYTCGTVNLDGACLGVIAMRRVLRDGDTYKAFVVRDPVIEGHVRRVAEALKPFGPCNFQLRVRDGIPYIFEINARCSGTTYCRTLAGFNEPMMTADLLLNGSPPLYSIRELTILRYWKELVVDNTLISQVQAKGVIDTGGLRL